jgi:hypothetical protein
MHAKATDARRSTKIDSIPARGAGRLEFMLTEKRFLSSISSSVHPTFAPPFRTRYSLMKDHLL